MERVPRSPRSAGLLISQDLFFASKVTGTARELGLRVDSAGGVQDALEKLAGSEYRCLIVDLATPGLDVAALTAALPAENRPRVIAFGSHVHTARLDEARAAGCDEVMPRSRFSATLAELLQKELSADAQPGDRSQP